MKRNRRRFRALFAVAALAAACGPGTSPDSQAERLVALDVTLTVVNQSTARANVSVESDSLRHELGNVPKGATRSFSFPIALVDSLSPVRLEANLGTWIVQSDSFVVQRGESVVWTLGGQGRGNLAKR